MSQSLIACLTESLDTGTIDRLAVDTGVSAADVVNGFRTASAAIVGAVVEKAADPNELRLVFELVTGGTSASSVPASAFDPDASRTDPDLSPVQKGERLLLTLFGRDQSSVVQKISHQSALPSHVVVQMMSIAAGKVVSFFAMRVREQDIPFSALRDLMLREAGDTSSYSSASVHDVPRAATPHVRSSPDAGASAPKAPSRNGRRVFAACLIAGLLLGISWLMRRARAGDPERVERVSRARTAIPGLGRFIDRELPGDVRINIPENGMESKLISCIQDSPGEAVSEQWFDFDRLTFDTNSAIPRAESEEQLANLASILKAYPQVRLKVGGYTDNRGNRHANQRLSENRAQSVRRELAGMNIDSSRVEVEGYGDRHPIADNTTEQGRAKNRRISVKVLQK